MTRPQAVWFTELPEVENLGNGLIRVGDYSFDARDGIVTWDDVVALLVAAQFYETHPEVVPSE